MYVVHQELYQLEKLLLYSLWLLGDFFCRLTQSVLILEKIFVAMLVISSSLCKPVAESNSRYLRDILLIWRQGLCRQD